MSKVPYASVLGSLTYAMVCTKPYIAYAVGFLSKYMSKPRKGHWREEKRAFRYLHGTTNYAIFYQRRPRPIRVIYV